MFILYVVLMMAYRCGLNTDYNSKYTSYNVPLYDLCNSTLTLQITDAPKDKSELETQIESSSSRVTQRKLANTMQVSRLQAQGQTCVHRPVVDVNSPSHDGQFSCVDVPAAGFDVNLPSHDGQSPQRLHLKISYFLYLPQIDKDF